MSKKQFFLVLDTETCTLPFVGAIASTSKDKKILSISKPLIYDIGWTIIDRNGVKIKEVNYLVNETFFVPNIFNTAYYRSKRPIYIDLFNSGLLTSQSWNDIVNELTRDMLKVNYVCASNATFDFKKAIPFTEKYIKNLYSNNFDTWMEYQRKSCINILQGDSPKNSDYLTPIFILREVEVPIIDIWGLACKRLLNNNRYKNFCIKNNLLTNSGDYFSTNVENCYRYLNRDTNFEEAHTALNDALIESEILIRALKRGKAEATLQAFPFRELGTTIEYVKQYPTRNNLDTLIKVFNDYLDRIENSNSRWVSQVKSKLQKLYEMYEERF